MTKRLIAVISGLLVLPAFAEVAPIYYDTDVIEYSDAEDATTVASGDEKSSEKNEMMGAKTSQKVSSARNISRVVPAATSHNTVNSRRAASARGVSSRATTARTTTNDRSATTRAAVADSASSTVTARGDAMRSGESTRARVGVNGTAGTAARISMSATGSSSSPNVTVLRTSGQTLYNATSSASRAGLRTNTGVASRVPTIRVASATAVTTPTLTAAEVTANMNELAELSDYCKAQYMECMDNFCNVLDDNQGRCTCSKNVKNYEKTEAALKEATEALQDVAYQIQYIGLSATDIETLFTETEAELKMSSTTDSSKLKGDLDRIKNMIVAVKSGTASVSDTTTSDLSFDLSGLLNFNFSADGFDLFSLFGTQNQRVEGISNQRGETLYKTAAARCKSAVLNSCQNQGVDTAVIINAYDMEIDKQCIQYERALTDANDQMLSTVRNAKTVLQKARLLVAQNKNSYDLRGCINALDACMQDDYVCGTDYEYCLDPSGKYIVNGEVVKGSRPGIAGGEYSSSGASDEGTSCTTSNGSYYCNPNGSGRAVVRLSNLRTGNYSDFQMTEVLGEDKLYWGKSLYSTWDYSSVKNAWSLDGKLAEYIDATISSAGGSIKATDGTMTKYLQSKIGYIDKDNRAIGMCSSVLSKCQNYSYSGTGSKRAYKADNDVVRQFLERAIIQIKAKQDEVLANYAESCVSDVSSCLSQNTYNFANSASSYSLLEASNPSNIAIRACMTTIQSCKSVTTPSTETETVYAWLDSALGTLLTAERLLCARNGDSSTVYWNDSKGRCACIQPQNYIFYAPTYTVAGSGTQSATGTGSITCQTDCGSTQLPINDEVNGVRVCSPCPDGQITASATGGGYCCATRSDTCNATTNLGCQCVQ